MANNQNKANNNSHNDYTTDDTPRVYRWEIEHGAFTGAERDECARRRDYEQSLEWLLSVIRYAPERVRRALGLMTEADQEREYEQRERLDQWRCKPRGER